MQGYGIVVITPYGRDLVVSYPVDSVQRVRAIVHQITHADDTVVVHIFENGT